MTDHCTRGLRMTAAWQSLAIGKKTRILSGILIISFTLMASASFFLLHYTYQNTGYMLQDVSFCIEAQKKMDMEEHAFRELNRKGDQGAMDAYIDACLDTEGALSRLPAEYKKVGAARFGYTGDVLRAYESYAGKRDQAAFSVQAGKVDTVLLSEVYERQNYIEEYLEGLTQITAKEGAVKYQALRPWLNLQPALIVAIILVIISVLTAMARSLKRNVISPILQMAEDAERIAAGNFEGPDVQTAGEEEISVLISSFNNMKHTTKESMETMRENRKLETRLHMEALRRTEAEKLLASARLDLLRNQIRPHFLFNTLNSIAGMAMLEDAETTEKMTRSLSNIFRYNLQTKEPFTTLQKELSILRDYLFVQKMRFGERLSYVIRMDPAIDPDGTMLPVFVLQPLAENAILHGIMTREEGGTLEIGGKIERGAGTDYLILTVADNGEGMDERTLTRIKSELPSASADHIGLRSVYQRIRSYYEDGGVTIESAPQAGTTVTIRIPGIKTMD